VQLALDARDEFWSDPANRKDRPRPLVAASIGSYGAYLADGSEYRGDYGMSEEDLMEWHRPRMALLAATGADILACETVPCLVEARALAHLLTEFPARSAWISFSARDGARTCHGEPLTACATVLDAFDQVAAMGINCTPPRYIADLISAIRAGTSKPILVYPNSGETYVAEAGCWTGDADDLSGLVQEWVERGARIIGGCCRTTPEQIEALRGRVRPDAGA
jgi:homocysteine S-methyltransferase